MAVVDNTRAAILNGTSPSAKRSSPSCAVHPTLIRGVGRRACFYDIPCLDDGVDLRQSAGLIDLAAMSTRARLTLNCPARACPASLLKNDHSGAELGNIGHGFVVSTIPNTKGGSKLQLCNL